MDNNTTFWISFLFLVAIVSSLFQKNKPYHSDVYSSREEERIDELEADMAYLMDKLEKKHY